MRPSSSRSMFAARRMVLAILALAVGCTSVAPASPTPLTTPPESPAATPTLALDIEVVQEALSVPWDVAFLPDGRMVVSERAGRLQVFASGQPSAELIDTIEVPHVRAWGEAGAMGMAVDRDFEAHPYLYLCASRDQDGEDGPEPWRNELLRFRVTDASLELEGPVFSSSIRANRQHNGCSVEADADGMIWMTTGDALRARAGDPQLDNLNGKVLRLNRDGTVPEDNPAVFGEVGFAYSIGHRNPQGLGFDPGTGVPYTAEHGPTVDDEINRIVAGGNYGWPCYTGTDTVPADIGGHDRLQIDCGPPDRYLPAVWASGDPTIATSGLTFISGSAWGPWDGNLVVATLKEQDLRRFVLDADGTPHEAETLLDGVYGRLRAVVLGPDGALYVTTSNARNYSREGLTPVPEAYSDLVIRIAPRG